jgi:glutamyl-Q tRNA(Asp) synthetase
MSVTRFAPSPTGRLHLGHAYSAVIGERAARESGGRFQLRIEDLDQTRSRPEFVAGIEEDLRWLGLKWDDEALVQSQRSAVYAATLDQLKARGLVYPCFCTRSDITAAPNAPHGAAEHRYPGTCRTKRVDTARLASEPHSWRLHAARAIELVGLPGWIEQGGRSFAASEADIDDEILARKDAPAAYHLACVVDDAASGIDLVVRGADLRPSTPVQRLLQMLLGLPEPRYLHHPLVVTHDGRRLAKRDRAPTLQALREGGINGPELARQLATGRIPSGFRLDLA